MLSWDHPKERPLPAWIDDKRLYPITIIERLSTETQKRLIEAGYVMLQDLAKADPAALMQKTGVPLENLKACIKEAVLILK